MNPARDETTPGVLLAHHLKQLKLPTVLREYDKVARECAQGCWNNGWIRCFTARRDEAHSSSVASTEPPDIVAAHDQRIMGGQRVRTPPRLQLQC